MPVDYSKYPENWKTVIRPDILNRAKNCCEECGVPNYMAIFRGYYKGKEVYQDADGNIYDAENSEKITCDITASVDPIAGDENQKAIKVVLTIAHLDHDIENNDYVNLKALCQKHHNKHDAVFRSNNRKNKGTLKMFE